MKQLPKGIKPLLVLLVVIGGLVFFYHCPFRFFFGVSCPGCGMTRALFAAIFKDFETAFYYHPLVPLLIPAGLYIGLQMFCGMRVPSRRQNVYIILLAAVMIIVYIVRVAHGDPVLRPDFSTSFIGRALEFIKRIAA